MCELHAQSMMLALIDWRTLTRAHALLEQDTRTG